MKNRSLLLQRSAAVLLAGLLWASSAMAVEPATQLFVVNLKPPSISIVDAKTLKTIENIPVDANPTYVLASPDRRFLYVLHNGQYSLTGMLAKAKSELAVVDVDARKAVKKIPLGWNTSKMVLTRDGRYLLCFNEGTPGSKKEPREHASVKVIATQGNEVAATLSVGQLGQQVIFTPEASRIFVLSEADAPRNKSDKTVPKPFLTVFALDAEKPLAEIELSPTAKEMALSPDGKWLYLLDRGFPSGNAKKNRNGAVQVVDVSALKLVATHDVGTSPLGLEVDAKRGDVGVLAQVSAKDRRGRLFRLQGERLFPAVEIGSEPQYLRRLGDKPGTFAFTHEDVRYLPDEQGSPSALTFNPKKGSAAQAARTLGGYPGEVLYLPGGEKAVVSILRRVGLGMVPTSKVAILDLKSNKIEHVVTTGRGSVKFGKFMGAMALSMAMTSLSYYGGLSMARATGSPFFYYNVYVFTPAAPNIELAASPDEKFVYALNTSTNDVTVIDASGGQVVGHVPVGGGPRRIAMAPGGRYFYSYTSGQLTLIDSQTNKGALEHKVTTGKINSVYADETDGRLYALSSKSILVFDTKQGKLETTIEGFGDPHFLVRP